MRQARVKESYRLPVVNAHTGRRYTKNEWRSVPDDGHICDLLDYQEVGETAVSDEPEADKPDAPTLGVDLESHTVKELQGMARERGLSYSGLIKAELIDTLKDD